MADKNDPHAESKFYFAASPFPATPQAESYCGIGSVEETRRRIKRSIERADGPSIVIGGPGLGKSLLCHLIASDYRSLYKVALLAEGQIDTSRELLQAIMFQLDLPYRDLEEGELRLALIDFLRPRENSGDQGTLLIVDEAQSLSSELLEEIRMISSIVRDGKPRVRTLLAGGSRLDENLSDPRLASFSQRIAARCYLHALSATETADYIRQQLQRVGAEPQDLISDAALSSVHSACDGIPRLINQLMNHVLFFAEQHAASIITPEIVQDAWADLQQLPMPTRSAPKTAASSVVDFGPLEDEGEADVFDFGELAEFDAVDSIEESASTDAYEFDAVEETSQQAAHEPAFSELDDSETENDLADHDSIVDQSFEMIETCVQLIADADQDHFAFDAGNGADSELDEEIAGAWTVESVLAAAREAHANEDASPTYVLGQYEDLQESTDTSDTEFSDQHADEIPADCGIEASSAAAASVIDQEAEADVKPFRDFPVLRLSCKTSSTEDTCDRSTAGTYEASDSSGSLASDALNPETVCYQDEFKTDVDQNLAEQLAIDVELNNVSDEPVTSEAAFGTIDDSVWNAEFSSEPVADQEGNQNPFGDDFEDEIAIQTNHPGGLTSPSVSLSAGSINPTADTSPSLWAGMSADANDPPEAENEDLLRAEVISINRAATDTNPGVVSGHFQGTQSRGHAAHSVCKPTAARDIEVADDRDLLYIEDEPRDEEQSITPRAAVPAASKTLDDLTTLFSRIRKG